MSLQYVKNIERVTITPRLCISSIFASSVFYVQSTGCAAIKGANTLFPKKKGHILVHKLTKLLTINDDHDIIFPTPRFSESWYMIM